VHHTVHESGGSSSSTSHVPAILRADDLFIRCDNAVFSGSKIHSRLLEAIVAGDLTIESLADEFRSDSHSADVGVSLAAIGGMTQDVKPDARFADPRLGAVPTMRFADEDAMSLKVREIAQMVGQERFYLSVGRLLHKKGATVGLKPDGVVVRNDAERISAGRILEEKVHEAESHHRRVINPAIGEFVAMMNQIDELQQVRAKIAQQQMLDNVPKPEREKNNREVNEFLQKPEVKEKVVQLKTAEKKLAQVTQKIAQLEMQDPTLRARVDGLQTLSGSSSPSSANLSATTTAPEASTSVGSDMLRLFEYTRAREERNTIVKTALNAAVSVKKNMDAYASSHNWPDRLKHGAMAVIQGVGCGLTAGAIVGAACEGGILAALATGGSIFATGEAFAAVSEYGADYLVDYAISQADTRQQARDYADVAISLVETGATGIAAFGAFKAVRGLSSKAAALRTSYSKSKIDSIFRQKRSNPAELEASVSKSLTEAVEKIRS
jgi:hypothetical protein